MKWLVPILLLLLFQHAALAEPKLLQSSDLKVNMLEVFTSQGCSSCPPAEQWLTKFEHDSRLWKQLIPINFHVDYWDYIGWKDPFSNAKFTKRQRIYEHLGLSKNVATPGFVMNGKGWNGWFYKQEPMLVSEKAKGMIIAKIEGKFVDITYKNVSEDSPFFMNKSLFVHVAILGFNVKTEVLGGENDGRELIHDFVVLAYNAQPLISGKESAVARMALPDASNYLDHKQAIVVWVSEAHNPSPIQAMGDWL